MALSLYDISVPVFSRGLGQLTHVLEKSLAHAKANDIDPETLVDARLAPDMITLAGQIQRASDASKLGVARISGITAPSFPDEEKTYDELLARIAKTQAFLSTVDRTLIDGQEERHDQSHGSGVTPVVGAGLAGRTGVRVVEGGRIARQQRS